MTPADLAGLVEVADPRVSPDGRLVAYVVITVDLEANDYRGAVWVASVVGQFPPRQLSETGVRDSRPRWAPDGTRLAFVRRQEIGCTLAVWPWGDETDDPQPLLEWPEEIEDLVWAPDGRRLIFTARERDEERYAPEKDKDRPPRRIDRLAYRLDSVGWIIDRPRHVLAVVTEGPDAGQVSSLTSGPYEDTGLAVSPDGRWVAFSGARTATWDTDLSTNIYRVPVAGGVEPEQLTSGVTTHGSPSWSPDGSTIAFVWGDRHSMSRHGQIGVINLSGGGASEQLLTTDLDLHCAPYLAQARDPVWEGRSLLFQVDEAGNVSVYRVGLDGQPPQPVVSGDRQITGFDAAGGTLAFVASEPTRLSEIFAVVEGAERRLTDHGAGFSRAHALSPPERFTAVSSDGTEVEAWVMRPRDFEEGRRYPTLLNIHGGPFSQYGNRFFDEFQVQAGAGYTVLYCNPRGSSGYSERFARGIRGPKAVEDPGTGWGGADYEDLMAVLDVAVTNFDFIDRDRLGVLGGSYGGYMTSWLIGHTNRFKAACSERACNNLFTFAHTSDIGSFFPAGYIGSSHLDDPEEFLRQSPVTYFRDMRTPLLILHSESDLRCPVEQAEDLYVRLKMTGRDVEFVRFPGESHELSRAGSPRHRMQRLELIIDWFDRLL
ncbi:MAG: S9 family peptidase [Actinobacteria bacterium]|nr:S9 family peptidase [Actinomycetota bacterium]